MEGYIDKLAWIYLKDGAILSTRSQGKDVYYIPGGKREAGETDVEALRREIKEELQVDLIVSSIEFFGTFEAQAHGKADGVVVRMTCYTASFTGELAPASEIEEMRWLAFADLDLCSPVDKIIFKHLHEKGLLL